MSELPASLRRSASDTEAVHGDHQHRALRTGATLELHGSNERMIPFSQRVLADLLPILGPEDDQSLFLALVDLLDSDIGFLLAEKPATEPVLIDIGICKHWLRPHQARWTAGGGFAWPTGYGSGAGGYSRWAHPRIDVDQVFELRARGAWVPVSSTAGRRPLVLRVAVPARSARHQQAAIHTVWLPGPPQRPAERAYRFLGFRRVAEAWSLTGDSNPLWAP